MHLYQAGMPLEAIALLLGHEDPSVTRVYARADTEMKRAAMEKAKSIDSVSMNAEDEGIWVGNEAMIKRLCGLD